MIRTIPRAQRRIAVVLQLISYPLLFSIASLLGIWPSVSTLLALIGLAGISAYLYHNTGLWQFGNAPDDQLDERQVQTRNQAYRLAYIGVSGLVVLLLIYLALANDLRLLVPRGFDQVTPFFWTIWTFVMVLPSAILAWTESDV
ncbi:hypothetical protein [Spirosoma arcticum]